MKTILTRILTCASVALLMLSACKKDGALVTSNGGKAGTLSATSATLVLDKTKLNDPSTVITFNFTAPDFGYSAAVTNTLQIDVPGDNWAKPVSATLSTKVLTQGYSTSDFNGLLLKLGLVGGQASQVQVRVQHSVGADVQPAYSNVLTLTVTPYNLKSWLYTVGAFQGWNINNCDSLLSATSNGIYTGIIYFPKGSPDFLVVPKKGSWDNKYATNDPTNNTSSTVTQNGPNNFFSPAGGGTYLVTLNLNNNTISFATPSEYYSIIGDAAIDWGTDIDMKYINDGGDSWVITTALKASGGFKIRKNHDWTKSYGFQKTPDGATLTTDNGGNMSVPTDGTYKLTFDVTTIDVSANYTLKKQ